MPMTPDRVADIIALNWPAGTVEVAEDVLRILRTRRSGADAKRPTNRVRVVNWRTVVKLVCTHYDVAERDLCGTRRFRRISEARFALYTALFEFLGLGYSDISRVVHRDHTTVLYGCGRVDRESPQWQHLMAELEALRFDVQPEAAE